MIDDMMMCVNERDETPPLPLMLFKKNTTIIMHLDLKDIVISGKQAHLVASSPD